jgi:signal transduction histidine kinase
MNDHPVDGATNEIAPRRYKAIRSGIIAAGLVLIVAVWAAVLAETRCERSDAIRQAERNAANLTLAFSEQTSRSLGTIDQTMRFLEADLKREGTAIDLDAWTRRARALVGFAVQISLVEPDGRVRTTGPRPPDGPMDAGDPAHLRVHQRDGPDVLHIGAPMLDPSSRRWTLRLTRRVEASGGGIAGILAVTVEPADLIRLYAPADLGDAGVVALVGLDGVVRARVGKAVDPAGAGLGVSVSGTPLFAAMSASDAGSMIGRSGLDHVERISAYRRVPGYPLAVLVGFGRDEVLAASDAASLRKDLAAFLVTLLLIGMAAYLVRETERSRRREAELAAERAKLASINRDLEISRDAAEAASRTKSAFLTNMSHELRTPLNAVIGFSEVMMGELMGPLGAPSYREYAAHIHDSGRRLLAVINDILDLSRIEAGGLVLQDEPIAISELITAAAAAAAPQLEAGELAISIDLVDAPPAIRGDADKLRQILDNLLSNAIKFTSRGGRVTVRTRRTREGDLALVIEDTGIGMSAGDMAVALEPFRQVDAQLSRRFGGAGLGLPLARRLAELHGGTLEIASVPGTGTTVTVVLPGASAVVDDSATAARRLRRGASQ